MTDARVPQLRERLGVAGDGDTFDKALANAVKKFQQAHELKATGQLTPQTVEALNGRRPDRPTDIARPTWNAGGGCRTTSARLT